MPARYWIAIAAVFGALAVIAGALGAHSLPGSSALEVPARIYQTAQTYHAIHAIALLGIAIVLLATEGVRTNWSSYLLNGAAAAFTLGILGFSGGIYVSAAQGFTSGGGIVPAGGVCLIAGWLAFAAGAFGIRRDG